MKQLDSASRAADLRRLILSKPSLRKLYEKFFTQYARCLQRCPESGVAVEIGSGAGLSKQIVPEIITTDILPYSTIDLCMDAAGMPFKDKSVRVFFMLNTFHHIPDVEGFFAEAQRCLVSGGRVLIIDQYPGWLSSWIYKYLHHEPFSPEAEEWTFETTGPLSGANGALGWIVFCRDREKFIKFFPNLIIDRFHLHTPLCYWLAGGLKPWNVLPEFLFGSASYFDDVLAHYIPQMSSFMDVELICQR